MSQRPGPDIGVPKQQHQIIAMLWLLSTAQNREEAELFLKGLEWSARHLWGWEPERLRAELVAAQEVLCEYQGKTTFWFTSSGMEFDYNCTPPRVE